MGQIKNGLLVGLVASVIIFTTSWLITSVVFPDYFAEMADGYRQTFVEMGMTDDEVAELTAAAIAGFWLRKKD